MKRLLARLAATSLACLIGRHRSCTELTHGLAPGTYCHCSHHQNLLAVKEAAS